MAQKFARIVVHGHNQLLEARSFPRDALAETRSLLGTDNAQGQISYIRPKWNLLFISKISNTPFTSTKHI